MGCWQLAQYDPHSASMLREMANELYGEDLF